MTSEQAQQSGRFEQALILGQIALALAGTLAFIFAPRSGEPVALYPISQNASQAAVSLMSAPQTLILARGRIDGSYIIRGNRPGFFDSLLRHGVLVLNASAPGCGPIPQGRPR